MAIAESLPKMGEVSKENLEVLSRLARFRVVTAEQARVLFPEYEGTSIQNARARLRRLEESGFVDVNIARPGRGAASENLYRLTGAGLRIVGREQERSVLAKRPRQWVLESLLFRNDVYARALQAGWKVASPRVSAPERIPAYLSAFNDWALRSKAAQIEEARKRGVAKWELEMAGRDLERMPKFLPKSLTFEFLYRLDQDRKIREVVLLVIDDTRRAIMRRDSPGSVVRPQIEELPLEFPPGMKIVVCARGLTFGKRDRRERKWKRGLVERYSHEREIFDSELEGVLQGYPRR